MSDKDPHDIKKEELWNWLEYLNAEPISFFSITKKYRGNISMIDLYKDPDMMKGLEIVMRKTMIVATHELREYGDINIKETYAKREFPILHGAVTELMEWSDWVNYTEDMEYPFDLDDLFIKPIAKPEVKKQPAPVIDPAIDPIIFEDDFIEPELESELESELELEPEPKPRPAIKEVQFTEIYMPTYTPNRNYELPISLEEMIERYKKFSNNLSKFQKTVDRKKNEDIREMANELFGHYGKIAIMFGLDYLSIAENPGSFRFKQEDFDRLFSSPIIPLDNKVSMLYNALILGYFTISSSVPKTIVRVNGDEETQYKITTFDMDPLDIEEKIENEDGEIVKEKLFEIEKWLTRKNYFDGRLVIETAQDSKNMSEGIVAFYLNTVSNKKIKTFSVTGARGLEVAIDYIYAYRKDLARDTQSFFTDTILDHS